MMRFRMIKLSFSFSFVSARAILCWTRSLSSFPDQSRFLVFPLVSQVVHMSGLPILAHGWRREKDLFDSF